MEFRILGPVEVWVAGRQIDAGPPRQRGVLVALAVDAGRPVAMDTVVDRVWGDAQNERMRHTLHVYVGRIRRTLEQAGTGVRLLHRSGGYVLDVDPDRVDAHRFRHLVERARDTRVADPQRVALLREALDLWRGTPLADVPGEWAARVREGWQQQRVDVVLGWTQGELRLGRPEVVIAALTEMISEYPLVESRVAVQMRALHAAGRGAEALETYARTRQRLADQLGADPGAELRGLHQALLRGELDPPPAAQRPVPPPEPEPEPEPESGPTGVPAQLPLDVYGFTGRRSEQARLDAILASAGEQPTAVTIVALSGTAGVGKTALAVHWAHRVRGRFPDGQLYVNLRGFDPAGSAMAPAEAVRGLLDALQAPPQRIPGNLSAQVGLYRSMLVGRRMLILLDNARDADQVRPLLPGAPGCLVLVTSRNQLPGLVAAEGAHPVPLGLLPAEDARQMLTRRMGAERVTAEPPAVDAIIDRCARLPLALAVVAARAATHPGFPLAAVAGELRDARSDLGVFTGSDLATDVRSVFSWSYRTLSTDAARLFRLLGLHPGPDLAAAAAASLAGRSRRQAAEALDELARAHLVSEHVPGRFTFHDLLRAYATELAHDCEAEDERRAAVQRLLDHYLHSAVNANRQLDPSREQLTVAEVTIGAVPEAFSDSEDAMEWFKAEHAVLLGAVRQADGDGFDVHVWQLAWALSTFFDRRGHWHDLIQTHQVALDAVRRRCDLAAEALIHRGLALSYSRLERYDEANAQCRLALDLYRQAGDQVGQAMAYQNLSWVFWRQEAYREALEHARKALPLFRAGNSTVGQATALNAIGWFHTVLGDHEEALASCRDALVLYAKIGNRDGEANTLDSMGYANHQLGNYAEAVGWYHQAADVFRDLGERFGEAQTLGHLGDTQLAMGDVEAARATWQRALATFEDLGHADAVQIREKLQRL